MKKNYIILAVLIGVMAVGFFTFQYIFKQRPYILPIGTANNFEECARAGYPVTMSYPRQCRPSEDKIFTEFMQ